MRYIGLHVSYKYLVQHVEFSLKLHTELNVRFMKYMKLYFSGKHRHKLARQLLMYNFQYII
jgi:hypothetical protein